MSTDAFLSWLERRVAWLREPAHWGTSPEMDTRAIEAQQILNEYVKIHDADTGDARAMSDTTTDHAAVNEHHEYPLDFYISEAERLGQSGWFVHVEDFRRFAAERDEWQQTATSHMRHIRELAAERYAAQAQVGRFRKALESSDSRLLQHQAEKEAERIGNIPSLDWFKRARAVQESNHYANDGLVFGDLDGDLPDGEGHRLVAEHEALVADATGPSGERSEQ